MSNSDPGNRPTVAFFLDSLYDQCEEKIWHSALNTAEELGLNLVCFVGGAFREHYTQAVGYKKTVFDLVDTGIFDGVIAITGSIGNYTSDEELKAYMRHFSPLPVICISKIIEGATNIVVENKAGMRQLMEHLIEVHHYRRIAFIRGPEDNADAEARYHVYMEALTTHDIPFDPELIVQESFIREDGVHAVSVLLDQKKVSFEVIVSANDNMAVYAIAELQRRGVRVPSDVAVTGFDDIQDILPPLTTVSQPFFEIGRESVKAILAKIRGDAVPERIELPTKLITRHSCGCMEHKELKTNADRVLSSTHLKEEYEVLFRLYHELDTGFDEEVAKRLMAEDLPRLGIHNFYLCLYEDGRRRDLARLFFHYTTENLVVLDRPKEMFPSKNLVPGHLRKDGKRFSYIVLPLHFKEEQFGFIFCEIGTFEGTIYEVMLSQISSTLKGVALMKEVKRYTGELERQVQERTKQLQSVLVKLQESNEELRKKNQVLYELTERDSLTGLYNHPALHRRLNEIFEESRRHKFPLSVIMIDIDDFKNFNDSYGHQIGDEILREFAKTMTNELQKEQLEQGEDNSTQNTGAGMLRKYDVAGRYGGDEFAVILPYCGENEAKMVSNRIFKSIKNIFIQGLGGTPITASFGVAVIERDTSCGDSKELIKMADHALYSAKKLGKDQVYIVKYHNGS